MTIGSFLNLARSGRLERSVILSEAKDHLAMLDGLKMILRSAQDDSLVRAISNDDFVIRSSVMTSTHAISVSPYSYSCFGDEIFLRARSIGSPMTRTASVMPRAMSDATQYPAPHATPSEATTQIDAAVVSPRTP